MKYMLLVYDEETALTNLSPREEKEIRGGPRARISSPDAATASRPTAPTRMQSGSKAIRRPGNSWNSRNHAFKGRQSRCPALAAFVFR